MKAKIKVYLKPEILDPQGKAVLHALNDMEFSHANDVRIGKYIEIVFNNGDETKIRKDVDHICQKLLSNPIMEKYEFELEDSN